MTLVSHPSGNTFVRALLAGLLKEDELGLFATALGFTSEPLIGKVLPGSIRAELQRRRYDVPDERFSSRPLREATRVIAGKFKLKSLLAHETGWACVDAVYRDLDESVARQIPKWKEQFSLKAVYAYEDGALASLQAARCNGLKAVYDLPIAYWETSRRLLEAEARRLPEWEPTLVGTRDSAAKLKRKTQELDAAEIVVCPSQFVLDSLPESARQTKRCIVAEFGTPEIPPQPEKTSKNAKLRVLFAGSMTQRKGLADLFSAFKHLDRADVELVVMGSPVADMPFYRSQFAGFTHEPTRPHAAVLELMRSCDVLALPSIVEGRALVQQEAMACGLPLLVTPNAGAQDMVEEGVTGFLVPPGRPDLIAERIDWMASNRDCLPEMGRSARKKARELTWERYAAKIIDAIRTA